MEAEHFVAYTRALEYLRKFVEEFNLSQTEINDMKRETEKLRRDHIVQNIRTPAVNVDLFLELIVKRYRQIIASTKQFIINAFACCDISGVGGCCENDFVLLWKYVNPETFEEDKAIEIFKSRTDKDIDGEMVITFDKFCTLAAELSLFSEDKQLKFIGVQVRSKLKEKYNEAQREWSKLKTKLKGMIDNFEEDFNRNIDWEYWLERIDEKMLRCNEKELPVVLIGQKILEKELLKSIKDREGDPADNSLDTSDNRLPSEFIAISRIPSSEHVILPTG